MATIAEEHQAYEVGPRKAQTLALGFDTTSRSYNLSVLAMGEPNAPEAGLGMRQEVFVTLMAEGADAYLTFSPAAGTVDDTAVIAVGTTLVAGSFTATAAGRIVKDGPPRRFRVDRSIDKFLNIKASAATGTLRLYVSSPASPST